MKIKLAVFERVVCSGMIPNEGKYYELQHIREVREELAMNGEELKLFRPFIVDESEGRLNARWDEASEVIPEKEIEFNEWLFDEIYTSLRELEKSGKLPNEKFTLYEKFVKQPEENKNEH